MFTDQYHLNNFIQRAAITAALVIKIGEGKNLSGIMCLMPFIIRPVTSWVFIPSIRPSGQGTDLGGAASVMQQ